MLLAAVVASVVATQAQAKPHNTDGGLNFPAYLNKALKKTDHQRLTVIAGAREISAYSDSKTPLRSALFRSAGRFVQNKPFEVRIGKNYYGRDNADNCYSKSSISNQPKLSGYLITVLKGHAPSYKYSRAGRKLSFSNTRRQIKGYFMLNTNGTIKSLHITTVSDMDLSPEHSTLKFSYPARRAVPQAPVHLCKAAAAKA